MTLQEATLPVFFDEIHEKEVSPEFLNPQSPDFNAHYQSLITSKPSLQQFAVDFLQSAVMKEHFVYLGQSSRVAAKGICKSNKLFEYLTPPVVGMVSIGMKWHANSSRILDVIGRRLVLTGMVDWVALNTLSTESDTCSMKILTELKALANRSHKELLIKSQFSFIVNVFSSDLSFFY